MTVHDKLTRSAPSTIGGAGTGPFVMCAFENVHVPVCFPAPVTLYEWVRRARAPHDRQYIACRYGGGGDSLYGTAWSLIPFFVVIPIAILTRQVIPGLMVGLVAGAYMIHPQLLGGLQTVLSTILSQIMIADNLRLILFLYGFGAFVGLIRVTGGITGFAAWMTRRIRTTRGAFALTWLSSLATFMAPDFRIITVAPIVKNVFSRLGVPPEKVAYVIDVTATPLVAVVPVGTAFVGYMVGLLSTSLHHYHGATVTPYQLFLQSLPWNLFSWVMIAWGLYATFFSRAKTSTTSVPHVGAQAIAAPRLGIASRAELARKIQNVRQMATVEAGQMDGVVHLPGMKPAPPVHDDVFPDAVEIVADKAQPRAIHLLVPLGLLLFFTLYLTWWDGHLRASSLIEAFVVANAAKAMLEALLITIGLSIVWYTAFRQPIGRTMFGFLAGGNDMMGVIVLLVFVWSVSAVSSDLGFASYTEHTIVRFVPQALLVPALFVFGCAVSYVIGSSFGTWGMLLPLGFSLAASTHASLPLIAGAVFASGTFGGFASPLSDNTVAMSTVMKLPLMPYARHKAKTALWAAFACTVLYAVVSWIGGRL